MKLNIKSLFLDNISLKQTLFKNTFWLIAAEVVSAFLRLGLFIYVARILGATEYGKFAFALSFVSVMVVFSNLGITDIVTREFSRNKEKEKEFPAILVLQIILSIGAFILMFIGSFFITADLMVQKTIWVLAIFILITGLFSVFYSFLRSRQRMEYEAGIKIVQNIIMVALVIFALQYQLSIVDLSYVYLLSNVIVLSLIAFLFNAFIQPVRLVFDKNIFGLLKISWPLTLTNTTIWFYMSISSIILGYFSLNIENGLYNAASRIAVITVLPATLIIASFYPVLSNFFITSKEKIHRSWDYLMQLMIFLAIPLVFGGIAVAPKIIIFFYGEEFTPAVFAFRVLILLVGINFVNYPYSLLLVVSDQQKKNFFLIVAMIVINIGLNITLVPLYGLNGTLIATSISSLLTLVISVLISKYFTPVPIFDMKLFKATVLSLFSGLIMFFSIGWPKIYNLHILAVILIGMCIYFLIAFLCFSLYKKALKIYQPVT